MGKKHVRSLLIGWGIACGVAAAIAFAASMNVGTVSAHPGYTCNPAVGHGLPGCHVDDTTTTTALSTTTTTEQPTTTTTAQQTTTTTAQSTTTTTEQPTTTTTQQSTTTTTAEQPTTTTTTEQSTTTTTDSGTVTGDDESDASQNGGEADEGPGDHHQPRHDHKRGDWLVRIWHPGPWHHRGSSWWSWLEGHRFNS